MSDRFSTFAKKSQLDTEDLVLLKPLQPPPLTPPSAPSVAQLRRVASAFRKAPTSTIFFVGAPVMRPFSTASRTLRRLLPSTNPDPAIAKTWPVSRDRPIDVHLVPEALGQSRHGHHVSFAMRSVISIERVTRQPGGRDNSRTALPRVVEAVRPPRLSSPSMTSAK